MFAYPAAVIQQAFEEALMTPMFTEAEREFIRDDVRDAVIDALELDKNGLPNVDLIEDWNFLGMSDPVHLPPLELEF